MSKTTNKFSPEVRERAVRLVLDNQGQHGSRWQAVLSISSKIGCAPQTLNDWVNKAEVNSGKRAGVTSEMAEKMKALAPYAVTENLMSLTEKDSIFMHCLPAHRGEEVEASVIDGPKSVIWREAYHRRTTIQALLYHLTRGELKGN